MKVNDYLNELRKIKDVAMATVDSGEIEIFDLSKVPIERSQYDLCDNRIFNKGYLISNRCIACDRCKRECPQQCIKSGSKYKIMQDHCLHCGLCYENCPVRAIEKVG